MGKVLVIDDETIISDVIGDYFRDSLGFVVECAHSGVAAAALLSRYRFDLAVIDATVGGVSGLELARLAANEDTPVLLISDQPETAFALHRFDFPHLPKPFTLARLRIEAARVMAEHKANVARVKASMVRMEANRRALAIALAESDRLLDVARRRLPLMGRAADAGRRNPEVPLGG